jgi:hypothetical protein
MTIDSTDVRIQQKGAARKGSIFGSHKYAGKSALRYKLGVDILVGNLVWVEGPYPAGEWNDTKFFNSVLSHCLELGECIEANNGYVGHANKIKCPNNDCNPVENLGMQGTVRTCHKTLCWHLKNWGILEKVYHHDITVHGMVFYACVVITQLAIANGKPLFEVEYGDE